ncbi:type II secretion system F family protein [Anaerorhabdus sp.]|jgi:type IV pilus assembly protein PilC|uniref:type II secretion system F family protein n=1 Tax=Anaerorhabdus sp. TaxID=1872524 RepID=UPI002FC774F7
MITYHETSLFCEQLSMILDSGLSLSEGLEVIVDEIETTNFKNAIIKIKEELSTGESFYNAVKSVDIFDSYFIEMIQVGEKTGYLDRVMKQCAIYYSRIDSMQNKVKDALFYPLILLMVMIVLMGILVIKILPIFREVLNSMGVDLSAASLTLMQLGQFVAQYGFIFLIILVVTIFSCFLYFKLKYKDNALTNFLSSFVLTKKLMINIETSKVAYALSLLINSGLNLKDSFSLLHKLISNKDILQKINNCSHKIELGEDTMEVFTESKILKPVYTKMLKLGLRSGKLDETMSKVAIEYEGESINSINRFLNAIEPTMMISCVIIVGVILLSVMLPLMSIMTSLG